MKLRYRVNAVLNEFGPTTLRAWQGRYSGSDAVSCALPQRMEVGSAPPSSKGEYSTSHPTAQVGLLTFSFHPP